MAIDQPWVYDPNATGSAQQSGMQGGAGIGSWVSNVGGMGSTTGLLKVTRNANGTVTRSIDRRVAATTLLNAGAAAASGAAAFSVAAGPGGAVAGAVLGAVGGAISGGLAAYDAQKTIASIGQLIERAQKPTTVIKPADRAELLEALNYCVRKSAVKRNKGIANATIVGQPATVLYKGAKAVYKFAKGTKGVNREKYAEYLVEKAKSKDEAGNIAREAVRSIMDMNYDQIAKSAVADAMKSG
jgi:hypothetical protein